jgi:hypothetical protein
MTFRGTVMYEEDNSETRRLKGSLLCALENKGLAYFMSLSCG